MILDTWAWTILGVKIVVILGALLTVVPVMTWVERRGAGLLQKRLGPNRVGPWGILQVIADVIKFLFKEDPVPGHVKAFYYLLAPIVTLVPALMTFAVIPFAEPVTVFGRTIDFQIADLNVGLLYVLAIASLGVYGIIIAGWSSNNKYSLLGSLRSSSQMFSYAVSMGLSVIGIVMIYQSVHPAEIAKAQGEILLQLGPLAIPKWGFFVQPLGFLIFLTAAFAETNRLPFDLPEGESEIVAGYHLEYGSMKFGTFMMSEYLNMTTAAGLITTLFFGGWQLLPGLSWVLQSLNVSGVAYDLTRVLLQTLSFAVKVGFFLWVFVWVRWTLPKYRYDQVMDLGWKLMFPLSLFNVLATGVLIYYRVI